VRSELLERNLVPERGLEPPLPCENQVLNLARLPVPPFGHRKHSTVWAKFGQRMGRNGRNCDGSCAECFDRANGIVFVYGDR
jgi:hypothetical protein